MVAVLIFFHTNRFAVHIENRRDRCLRLDLLSGFLDRSLGKFYIGEILFDVGDHLIVYRRLVFSLVEMA